MLEPASAGSPKSVIELYLGSWGVEMAAGKAQWIVLCWRGWAEGPPLLSTMWLQPSPTNITAAPCFHSPIFTVLPHLRSALVEFSLLGSWEVTDPMCCHRLGYLPAA